MANYHVSRNDDGSWKALKEGGLRAAVIVNTQRSAEIEAKKLVANSGGGEVRIHGLDGRIRDSGTVPPANDPCPPRDRMY